MTNSWLEDAEAALDTEAKQQALIGDAKKWDPEPNGLLKGVLLESKYFGTKYGFTWLLHVLDSDSQVWAVWGGRTMLKNAIEDQTPAIGKGIAIRYHGMKEGKEFKYHDYTLSCEPQGSEELAANLLMYMSLIRAALEGQPPETDPQTASQIAGLSDPF